MQGGMMETALTIPGMITPRVEGLFGHRPVITQCPDPTVIWLTWRQVSARARRLAGALRAFGVEAGDRVATFAWSTHRHVEAYLAAPSMGAVLHTINPQLPLEQITYIVEDADDSVVLCDRSLLHKWQIVQHRLTRMRPVLVLPDQNPAADDVADSDNQLDYEALLANAEPLTTWPEVDENSAAHISYTTGTTGRPKGVVFTHRSTVLQSMAAGLAAAEGLCATDTVCVLVPLFLSQVGIPYAAALHGAGLLLPGSDLSAPAVCSLIAEHRPTVAIGFGAALIDVLDHWRHNRPDLSSLRRLVCGGSAVPRSVSRAFEDEVGVELVPVFGMTETSGHGSFSTLPLEAGENPTEDIRAYYATSQGRPLPLVEMRLADDTGSEIAHDGRSMGELQIRGPWVAREYFHMGSPPENFTSGWLRTGDAARIDELGYIRVADRMKDLIRHNDEWISSLELEEHLMAHPAVLEAAVVAAPRHDGDGEQPAATVVLKDAASASPQELIDHLRERVPETWLPHIVRLTTQLPKTSIGKTDKKALRAQFITPDQPIPRSASS